MRTRTYVLLILLLMLAAVGCQTLLTPDPVTGVTPAADASLTLVKEIAESPSILGIVKGISGAAAIIATAYFGRKKIAAGAKVAGRVVGIFKARVEDK